MPYLRRINYTSTKTYASRTILFLQKNGTLKLLAIELSLPHSVGDQYGAVSKVYLPAEKGVEKSIWQLAKAYVAVVDSGYHQLISHWYEETQISVVYTGFLNKLQNYVLTSSKKPLTTTTYFLCTITITNLIMCMS